MDIFVGSGHMNIILVSSANNIGTNSLFIILIKSFIYIMEIAVVPRWTLVAHCV
jgi:hypothetical protein